LPILNYTTEVNIDRTLSEIGRILAKAKARSILTDYDEEGVPTRISFLVETQHGRQGFRLPANAEAVFAALAREASAGKVPRRYVTRQQAARVGWRIVKDWLEAQLAMVEAELVTIEQVMLPYMVVENDRTVYELMEERRFLLSTPSEE
jgi:hypothetical protein